MKSSDIPEKPILQFLLENKGKLPATWFDLSSFENKGEKGINYSASVREAFPSDVPDKLILSKMRKMILKELVAGCTCGCRGDFEITKKGEQLLKESETEDDSN